nr:hypothetical protein [Akkermansia muciniphila]
MQIKTRSTLPAGAFFIQVVVLLDLVVLVCVLTIMTSRVGMAYGYEVKAPSSHFLMNIVGDVEFISVTAGDQPAFYIGNRLIEAGCPAFPQNWTGFPGSMGRMGAVWGLPCVWMIPFHGPWNSSWWIWCLPRG